VRGESPLEAGLSFLPMTLVLFALVRVVPRAAARIGDLPLLVGGLLLAASGMAWLSRISESTEFVLGIGAPLILMGVGMGAAFTPLTTAGIHAVSSDDAGAASGLVNAAHQLGGAIGIAVLVTVFAGAGGRDGDYAHALSTALFGSVICLLLAVTVVIGFMWRPALAPLRAPATTS
jgi:hypothetical protein